METPDSYTAEEAAQKLRVSIMPNYQYSKVGKINAHKIGEEFRIGKNDIKNLLERAETN